METTYKNLSDKDIELLKELGHTESDFIQIDKAIEESVFVVVCDTGVKTEITATMARALLGDKSFLSCIGKSAFHSSCLRIISDDKYICFDSRKLFALVNLCE